MKVSRSVTFVAMAVVALLGVSCPAKADYAESLALFRSGKYAECIEATKAAIAQEVINENDRSLKIRAELVLGRYKDAAETLEEGLKKYPRSLELRWLGRDVCRYNNQPERADELDGQFAELAEKSSWMYGDALNRTVIARFLLSKGADPKKVLNGIINEVKRLNPSFTPAHLASGELALEKGDYALAAESFEQAIKSNPAEPDAYFGLAQAFAPSDSEKAQKALKQVFDRNPNHVAGLLLMIDGLVDSERYDLADDALTQVESVNPHHPQAAAYRAVLAHLRNQPASEKKYREAALKFWKTNPNVDYLIGKKLSQKYRFAEGEKFQRQALAFDAKYLPAKMQLAQDLLRLGREDEGWKLADAVSQADGYNVVAHNLMVLQENVAKFRTLEEDGIVARMEAKEAEIYGRRVLDLLKRAKRVLCAKYEVQLEQPVIVELFPRQQDFAIRTFGLPGGAGFLGVCFGTVITANSPASQGDHPSCWEATLWHEFCHVVTLNKTHNKMPRWLSEGISVYEERQADRAWGQSINPAYRQMLLADDLTPVSRLSAAFLHPASPLHLQFAYFESSLVVEFLVETHGLKTLNAILDDLGNGITINDALTRHGGSLEELDKRFIEYAHKHAAEMAPKADWTEPDLSPRADAKALTAWLKEHPNNFAGLKRLARQQMADKDWKAARETLEKLQKLYPGDSGTESVSVLLARVYREMGETAGERKVLERVSELSADNIETFARLTELLAQAGEWDLTRKYALRWLAVNPLHAEPHRRAADAAEHLGDTALAIASQRALLQMDPIDPAEIHLRLATVLQKAGDLSAAKRHALLALEETPRFRAAQQRLLDIVGQAERNEKNPGKGKP